MVKEFAVVGGDLRTIKLAKINQFIKKSAVRNPERQIKSKNESCFTWQKFSCTAIFDTKHIYHNNTFSVVFTNCNNQSSCSVTTSTATLTSPFSSIVSVTALGNSSASFLKFSSALLGVCIFSLSI